MFYGVSHIDVPVRNLVKAEQIYSVLLDFPVAQRGEGWFDVNAGGCLLRVLESKNVERPATLRVQTPTVEDAVKRLADAGLTVLYDTMRTPDLELMSVIADADGNNIVLWRKLLEDEYGYDPEIPKEMTWDEDADELLKSLLKAVPSFFRPLARRKVAKNAEWYARERGTMRVNKDLVVRAYIISNAKVTRDRVRKPLIEHGYKPEDYPEEFDA